MLRAEDGFNVRDRLDDIQTETLVICGHAVVIAPEFFRDVTAFLGDKT